MIELSVSLAHGSADEGRVAKALVDLRSEYDLSAFEWTYDVVIDETAIPHSHPVLTLSTAYVSGDDRLLATYLHEQLHYWSMTCPGATDGRDETVYDQLRTAYPLPIDPPEGCGSELSNLIHLHVCWLELGATSVFLGRSRAEALFGSKHYYRAVYRKVLDEEAALTCVFEAAGMGPPPHA